MTPQSGRPRAGVPDPSTPARRVNPLFLPGTALRFVVLVIVAVATTWDSWQVIVGSALGHPYRVAMDRCVEGVSIVLRISDVDPHQSQWITPAERGSLVDFANRSCTSSYGAATTGIAFAVVLALVAGTLVLYWFWPGWYIRNRRLIPFPQSSRFAMLGADLASMAATSWTGPVTFLLDVADQRVAGRAFGRVGRRYVVLSRGLIAVYDHEPGTARAIVAHELAHLRNRDVDAGYAAVWIWRLFLALAVAPMTVWAAWSAVTGRASDVLTYGWRVAAAAVLGWLIRCWLLRYREYLADARAYADGADGLVGLLAAQPAERPAEQPAQRLASRWARSLRLHPSAQQRARALMDPRVLMRARFWENAAIGMIAMLAYGVATMVGAVLDFHGAATAYLGTTLSAAVVTWSISQCVLRAALAERFDGPIRPPFFLRETGPTDQSFREILTPTPGVRAALGMGFGLVAGRIAALDPAAHADLGHSIAGYAGLLEWWTLYVCLYMFFLTGWCFLMAQTWMRVIARTRHPVRVGRTGLVFGFLVALPVLPKMLTRYFVYVDLPWERAGISSHDAIRTTIEPRGIIAGAGGTTLWLATAAFIVMPLLPQLRRSRTPRDWVTLDPPIEDAWKRPPARFVSALFCGLLLVVAGDQSVSVDPGTWMATDFTTTSLAVTSPIARTVHTAVPKTDMWPPPCSGLGLSVESGLKQECQDSPYALRLTDASDYSGHQQDLVIYTPDDVSWARAYVAAVAGQHVTCAGAGAPIEVDGSAMAGRPLPDEETTSNQAFDLTVPEGKVWATALHWDRSSPTVYVPGETGGGLVDTRWVIGYVPVQGGS